ncbi:MAG: 50S ribosomal protein L30 [Candidatus Marinimicrobia bacterium]|nr:50S ribosomal protein L30 [Candidatus Neomarinimicrobiota bacterium]
MAKSKTILKITQVKSTIGYREKTKKTMEALGLGKIRKTVTKQDNPAMRGMLRLVDHLVVIEEVKV